MLTSVDNPPIKSLMNELDLINAYIEPIYTNFENISEPSNLIEKEISNIKETSICNDKSEINNFIQLLKTQEVL